MYFRLSQLFYCIVSNGVIVVTDGEHFFLILIFYFKHNGMSSTKVNLIFLIFNYGILYKPIISLVFNLLRIRLFRPKFLH